MPKVKDVPAALRAYVFHGVDLAWDDGPQAVGDCPWCGREGKFTVEVAEGVWRCWACQEGSRKGGGNAYTFLRLLWEKSTLREDAGRELARDRRLLDEGTPRGWGAVNSALTGELLLPGYNAKGVLVQLYRYVQGGRRKLLLPTPGMNPHEAGDQRLGLFRAEPGGPVGGTVYVCEGPWDAMSLWEVLRLAKPAGDGLAFTGNTEASLAADSTVVAVPGAGVFSPSWREMLKGRKVVLCHDNDDAGRAGARRVATLLAGTDNAEHRPEGVSYVRWPAELAAGHDVRDWLTRGADTSPLRVGRLGALLGLVGPVPDDWSPGGSRTSRPGGAGVELLPCRSWPELRNQWRKAMRWIDGLEHGLTCMLATVLSTPMQGDQLWIKLVGPPSCGKSVLCEALSTNARYVKAKSTIRGLFSGYQVDREGSEDVSLAPRLRGMTLVTKDGDTLLQMPNLGQILAEFRDLYDKVSRTQYRNKMSRDHEGLNMTWVLAGTEALRRLDSSELGERMLDVVVCHTLEEEVEREIALSKAYQAIRDLNSVYDGKPETRDPPEMVRAKQLTGGYVQHLRDNAAELLAAVHFPDGYAARCTTLGEFVSFMRSRPSKSQDEAVQRELSFRLVSQLTRLAKCLAAVLQKPEVDEEVMARVTRVALDTSRGRTMEMVERMALRGREGCYPDSFPVWLGLEEVKANSLLKHLRGIGVAEQFREGARGTGRYRYRLTPRLVRLYAEVIHGA